MNGVMSHGERVRHWAPLMVLAFLAATVTFAPGLADRLGRALVPNRAPHAIGAPSPRALGATGEAYPKTPNGGISDDSIGNILDHLPDIE